VRKPERRGSFHHDESQAFFSGRRGRRHAGQFRHRAGAGEAPLVLGQSAPFTGPAAQLGIQFHQGAKLFLDQYNAQPAAATW
jgi:branched-chain amino acid transport system substrate-binding protein